MTKCIDFHAQHHLGVSLSKRQSILHDRSNHFEVVYRIICRMTISLLNMMTYNVTIKA